jgi:putative addiction module antidote
MHKVKLTSIGTSTGIVIPKDVLSRLNVEKGDFIYLTEGADGITLSAFDPELSEELELGRKFMGKYRETYRALAK